MGVDDTPENRAKFEASFPRGEALKHNTSLGYVANAAVYLCSDDAALVSGICMPVDGAATVYAAGGESRVRTTRAATELTMMLVGK